jgi:hypothetical protein
LIRGDHDHEKYFEEVIEKQLLDLSVARKAQEGLVSDQLFFFDDKSLF